MSQSAISIISKNLSLEGVLATPNDLSSAYPGVVVCHPHPLFGGDMNNQVVLEVCGALVAAGFATLRFNFRGVGNSQGEHTKGEREPQDVYSALDFLGHWTGVDRRRLGLAGYSFGAAVILSHLSRYKKVKTFALISPPLSAIKSPIIVEDNRAKLFIVGDRDRLVQAPSLKEALCALPQPSEYHLVPGADHSWRGHENEVALGVAQFFIQNLR